MIFPLGKKIFRKESFHIQKYFTTSHAGLQQPKKPVSNFSVPEACYGQKNELPHGPLPLKTDPPCDIINGMNEETLRKHIAKNLAFYRKHAGLTQAELAGLINYSDKSVSKWERGEGTPDVYVLTVIAGLLGVTVNDLISDAEPVSPKIKKRRSMLVRGMVPALSAALCWLCGTVIYFILRVLLGDVPGLWLTFLYTAVASAVVLVVFSHIWWSKVLCCVFVSILIWLCAVAAFLSVSFSGAWLIFVVAAVLWVLAVLWYVFLDILKKTKQKKIQ